VTHAAGGIAWRFHIISTTNGFMMSAISRMGWLYFSQANGKHS
jgi:hypothetical protein